MAGPGAKPQPFVQPKLRLDNWLWAARFFKSRDLAVEVIERGHVRINGMKCRKPGHGVGQGDVLTFAQAGNIRVIRVTALHDKRGSATDAQQLYADLDQTTPSATASPLE